jgi:hypothetical protein
MCCSFPHALGGQGMSGGTRAGARDEGGGSWTITSLTAYKTWCLESACHTWHRDLHAQTQHTS